MPKYTQDQIRTLANQMERAKQDNDQPFSLLTGAGCSVSAGIPLAMQLVKEIQKTFGNECNEKLTASQLNDYGACMGCLTKKARRKLLEPYLNNAKINWAHIAIASMMKAGFIGRVLTFNFDSILARACSLSGIYPATYDFAAAATVDTNYLAPQSIIHLHGQGYGMSLLNSNQETQQHAKNIRPLIHNTLLNSSILVVGYSGQSDAVFPVIKEEYSGDEWLWWAGFNENFDKSLEELFSKHENTARYLGNCDADRFLIELAQELKCFPPKLFKDPYGHILEELNPVTEFPLTGSSDSLATDILKNLRAKLAKAQKKDLDAIDNLNNLMMEGDWQKIIAQADPTNPDHKEKLSWAYLAQADNIRHLASLTDDETMLQNSFTHYQRAIEIEPNNYEALNSWGIALKILAKLKKDEKLFQSSFEKYRLATEIKENNYEAFFNWAIALHTFAKIKNDDAFFEESFKKYQCAVKIKPDSHHAFNNWGSALFDLAKRNNDEAIFLQSIEKYRRAIEINADWHFSLMNLGSPLLYLFGITRNEEHLSAAKEVLEKAESLNADDVYNLACAYSQLNELEKCKQRLLHCKNKGTLPANPKKHLLNDRDLENVKNLDWFQELIADLPD